MPHLVMGLPDTVSLAIVKMYAYSMVMSKWSGRDVVNMYFQEILRI